MNAAGTNTEEKILEAAKTVFIHKGLEGARMQEIADEAGINKALLHYYYRTKEKLFSAVFKFAFSRFTPHIMEIISQKKPFPEKLEQLVDQYISMLHKNQFIPMFILHEINRDPNRIVEIMKSTGINPEPFLDVIQEEIDKGIINISSPQQLVINLLSLCVFPIAARPMMQAILFNGDKKLYNEFLEGRKKEVTRFILAAIK